MLLLAIATSIDAFAVGVTLPLLHGDVPQACLIIGVVTALMSALGLLAGRKFGDRLGRGADAAGGALLIVIGLKILFEHLSPT
jgi:putative Mn2+ efflux pump MntP